MDQNELLKIIERAAEEKSTELALHGKEITSLPAEIGSLTNLKTLYLYDNQLTSIPAELGNLTNLMYLDLAHNQLKIIPAELGNLTNLKQLYLDVNQLTGIPAELGNLANLTRLVLSCNQLTGIPAELGNLTNLRELYLHDNQLTGIPAELGNLTNLTELLLSSNQLTGIPAELGKLTNLRHLSLDDNKDLTSPPPEVVKQGKKAILAYLRGLEKKSEKQWISKMILVGEGGVGKTQLLRALQGKKFQVESETTHGIGIEPLNLKHPKERGVSMLLNCWDFGGQEIYHATHQFFLTRRSLFVLVWDTRQGWEAGKLYKWMDAIEARSPGSPVLIVATKIDERDADLPLEDLLGRYDSIIRHCEVSNKTHDGIEVLREAISSAASALPLMGEEWPAAWLEAAKAIRKRKEQYISPKKFYSVMSRRKVRKKDRDILAQWMHDLGDILYFSENEELSDLVILDPAWVNEKISRVLESKEVIKKDGIFTRVHMDKLWGDIEDENIRQHLLRLMEQFDLSYRTLRNREISLVVERLPLDPPNYRKTWDAIQNIRECKEISMKFSVGSLQAGLPTWFIARSHRFSIHKHWRMGALFADGKEKRHLGLIEAYEYERYLRLTVRGPMPCNFFALLRDGLELTLARFPGLEIRRTIPCPGHDGQKCKNEFDVEQLEGAFKENVTDIPCPETHFKKTVSVPEMLFGLHTEQYDPVLQCMEKMEARLAAGHDDILNVSVELNGLVQRGFTSLFNAQQGLEESHCPNVFAVLPNEGQSWLKNLFGQKMVMQLYCQAPGQWHPAVEGSKGGSYEIRKPSEFFKSMGPYILKLAKVIKYAAPVAGAAAGLYAGPASAAMVAGQIKLMEELAKKLADRDYLEANLLDRTGVGGKAERIEGMELRALRALLDKEDPRHEWGGLKKVLTPEGHYLWLCEEHAGEYRK